MICDRAQGEAFWHCLAIDLTIKESDRPWIRRRLRSVSIKIALSFRPGLPSQNSFTIKLQADTFDEESPETAMI